MLKLDFKKINFQKYRLLKLMLILDFIKNFIKGRILSFNKTFKVIIKLVHNWKKSICFIKLENIFHLKTF